MAQGQAYDNGVNIKDKHQSQLVVHTLNIFTTDVGF